MTARPFVRRRRLARPLTPAALDDPAHRPLTCRAPSTPFDLQGVYATWDMKAGMVLDTMYISSTKKPYQLAVGSVTGTRVVIKSVGTSATTFLPNIK